MNVADAEVLSGIPYSTLMQIVKRGFYVTPSGTSAKFGTKVGRGFEISKPELKALTYVWCRDYPQDTWGAVEAMSGQYSHWYGVGRYVMVRYPHFTSETIDRDHTLWHIDAAGDLLAWIPESALTPDAIQQTPVVKITKGMLKKVNEELYHATYNRDDE